MPPYLRLDFDAPLQSCGGVAVDPRRPTDSFPRKSALAGLLANALGWRHRDADRITLLQDALDYAVREDRSPARLWDYQTADLSSLEGWTRWGPEKPGGAFGGGTHILEKEYLADARFTVALGLLSDAPVSLADVEEALVHPARPLFLGRKCCIPAGRILRGQVEAPSAVEALLLMDPEDGWPTDGLRVWCEAASVARPAETREVWDRRDYVSTRFDQSRQVAEFRMMPSAGEESHG